MSDDRDKPANTPRLDDDVWPRLRKLTAARIGLGRRGASIATAPTLDFRLAHARARDAVYAEFSAPGLTNDLARLGMPALTVESAAPDKRTYLMRPDLGRRLTAVSEAKLLAQAGDYDVAFVVSDGLSAQAVQSHASPLLALVAKEQKLKDWRVAPIIIVERGRVAVGDQIAAQLRAQCVVVLIGERPGLSAPDSMGVYVTWQPRQRTTDADRNCISNIRPDGVAYAEAAFKLAHLLLATRAKGLSGIGLKDDSDTLSIPGSSTSSQV